MKSVPSASPRRGRALAARLALVRMGLWVGSRHDTGCALGRLDETAPGAMGVALAARSCVGDQKTVAAIGLLQAVSYVIQASSSGTFPPPTWRASRKAVCGCIIRTGTGLVVGTVSEARRAHPVHRLCRTCRRLRMRDSRALTTFRPGRTESAWHSGRSGTRSTAACRATPGSVPGASERRSPRRSTPLLSIQTTLPGAYWLSAMGSPWLGAYRNSVWNGSDLSRSKTWKATTSVGKAYRGRTPL